MSRDTYRRKSSAALPAGGLLPPLPPGLLLPRPPPVPPLLPLPPAALPPLLPLPAGLPFRCLLRCRCFCCRLLRCRRLRCCLLLCCLRSLLCCRRYGCLLFARLLLCSLLGRICRCLGCRLFSLLTGCFLRCKLSLKSGKKVFLFLDLRRKIRCRELLGADILRILSDILICRSDQILYLSLSRLVLRF